MTIRQYERENLGVALPEPLQAGLTVADVARRYRVGEDKIRRWISTGELRATNTATVLCGRPRWVISPDALAEFERRRASGPPPKVSRRPRHAAAIDYFPD
jgi:excisionase family DNA binding protein